MRAGPVERLNHEKAHDGGRCDAEAGLPPQQRIAGHEPKLLQVAGKRFLNLIIEENKRNVMITMRGLNMIEIMLYVTEYKPILIIKNRQNLFF